MPNYKKTFEGLYEEMGRVIIGQHDVIEQTLAALLSNGNALLEGYPGLAKTLIIKTLSELMELKFSRIQNTPDLMPSDITGTYIIEDQGSKRAFKFHPGPIFANMVLADEINRATPKTQSALLEAMQEKQVTVGNTTFKLDLPFFVLATQNPIEQEGTYPLPEAQADRFLLKIKVDYPSYEDELAIATKYAGEQKTLKLRPVVSKSALLTMQEHTRQVPIAADVKEKVVKLIMLTRSEKALIEYGASPRASISLILASKARALMNGRNYVSVEDIRALAMPVLRHRIVLNFESERKGMTADEAVKQLMAKVK
ncbi:MAG TPA: MoxR family ATPase [Candidatus Nanoarchaeia archaeon]|nr:MoxR family ATPase [Candidatus Nanoarchaeia archaeon]